MSVFPGFDPESSEQPVRSALGGHWHQEHQNVVTLDKFMLKILMRLQKKLSS